MYIFEFLTGIAHSESPWENDWHRRHLINAVYMQIHEDFYGNLLEFLLELQLWVRVSTAQNVRVRVRVSYSNWAKFSSSK